MFGVMEKAVAQLSIYHSFFVEFMFSMKYHECEVTPGGTPVPTAATNGLDLFVNPKFANTQSPEQKIFVLLHELMHKINCHPARRGGRNSGRWGVACDHAVNLLLKEYGIQVDVNRWYCDSQYANMSAEQIYDLLPESLDSSDTDVLDFDGDPSDLQTQVKELMAKAVAGASMEAGSIPGCLKALIESTLKDETEHWYSRLHRYMQGTAMNQYSWTRNNYRTLRTHGVLTPNMFSECLNNLAVFMDTSGSCFDIATQQDFCGHLNAILAEVRPRTTDVYHFDTQIQSVESFAHGEVDVQLQAKGGGGTDFRFLFDDLTIQPDVAIVLTDLEGPVGEDPGFPVLWLVTTDNEPPFGEAIYVK